MLVFVTLVVVFVSILLYVTWIAYRLRKLRSLEVGTLLHELRDVDMVRVFSVADFATGMADHRSITTQEVLANLGGREGLKNLSQNASHMMELARYLSTVRPEFRALAVTIRRDSSEVRQLIGVIRIVQYCTLLQPRQPLMKVAVAYSAVFRNMSWLFGRFIV